MKVITISGRAGAGKDACANILNEELTASGYKVLEVHMADYLKFVCKQYLGWNGKKDVPGREFLQYVGTDVVREKCPTFWVDIVCMLIGVLDFDYFLIPDVRFPNEIETLKEKFDVVTILIERPAYKSALTEEQKNHISERSLDGYLFDFTIVNEGNSLDNFRDIVILKSKFFT